MNFINTIMNFYEDSNINSKDKYIDSFKLPIEYLDSSCIQVLNKNIINDLELVKIKPPLNENSNNCEKSTALITNEVNEEHNLYYHVFNPKNVFEKNIINRWSKYYTNNEQFLLETQLLLQNYNTFKKVEFSETKTGDNIIYTKCEEYYI